MYPTPFRLPEVTAHVISYVERRRRAFPRLDEGAREALEAEARHALGEVEQRFRAIADDSGYWTRLSRSVLSVALPRYFREAEAQAQLELRGYGVWRGGDLVSRAVYFLLGSGLSLLLWRARLPVYFEALPLLLMILGPVLPDAQIWFARRAYDGRLRAIIEEMRDEERQLEQYRPLDELSPPPVLDERGVEPDGEPGADERSGERGQGRGREGEGEREGS